MTSSLFCLGLRCPGPGNLSVKTGTAGSKQGQVGHPRADIAQKVIGKVGLCNITARQDLVTSGRHAPSHQIHLVKKGVLQCSAGTRTNRSSFPFPPGGTEVQCSPSWSGAAWDGILPGCVPHSCQLPPGSGLKVQTSERPGPGPIRPHSGQPGTWSCLAHLGTWHVPCREVKHKTFAGMWVIPRSASSPSSSKPIKK